MKRVHLLALILGPFAVALSAPGAMATPLYSASAGGRDAWTFCSPTSTAYTSTCSISDDYFPGTSYESGATVLSSANLANGDLMAQSTLFGPYSSPTNAGASISDILTFSGNFSGTDVVTVTMSAVATYIGPGTADISLTGQRDYDGFTFATATTCVNPDYSSLCEGKIDQTAINHGSYSISDSGDELSITETFPLIDLYGGGLKLSFSVGTYGEATIYDPISITVPEGVTYTSDSGVFLSELNTTPVPEPFSLSLFGAGLAGLTALRRRRKSA